MHEPEPDHWSHDGTHQPGCCLSRPRLLVILAIYLIIIGCVACSAATFVSSDGGRGRDAKLAIPSYARIRLHLIKEQMKRRQLAALLGCGAAARAFGLRLPKQQSRRDILDNPCGKVSVKQMGLVHAGKFDEGNKLSTRKCRTSGRRCRQGSHHDVGHGEGDVADRGAVHGGYPGQRRPCR